MGAVFKKSWLDEHIETLPSWQQHAYQSFSAKIADDANTFPCVPARRGFLSDQLRFSFIGDPRKVHSIKELADCLRAYDKCARTSGKYTSLAIFIETPEEVLKDYDVEDYRNLFWTILNKLTAFDKQKWPADIPSDPTNHAWEFCFEGEPYFVFCATPAHQLRKSRHFPTLFMAFQPRWVFEDMNDSTVIGQKLKKLIRKRIDAYDGVPCHPDLKWYGQVDNHEWKQYFISDDDNSPTKCPFLKMQNQHINPPKK